MIAVPFGLAGNHMTGRTCQHCRCEAGVVYRYFALKQKKILSMSSKTGGRGGSFSSGQWLWQRIAIDSLRAGDKPTLRALS